MLKRKWIASSLALTLACVLPWLTHANEKRSFRLLPLSEQNLAQNLKLASSEEEVRLILRSTKLEGGKRYGVSLYDILKIPPQTLKKISPLSARILLERFFMDPHSIDRLARSEAVQYRGSCWLMKIGLLDLCSAMMIFSGARACAQVPVLGISSIAIGTFIVLLSVWSGRFHERDIKNLLDELEDEGVRLSLDDRIDSTSDKQMYALVMLAYACSKQK